MSNDDTETVGCSNGHGRKSHFDADGEDVSQRAGNTGARRGNDGSGRAGEQSTESARQSAQQAEEPYVTELDYISTWDRIWSDPSDVFMYGTGIGSSFADGAYDVGENYPRGV